MNTYNTRQVIITATAAAICITGSFAAAPAQATTDANGGCPSTSSTVDIGQIVAMRKAQMAADYVTNAVARATYTGRTR
jgi:hypothetical protein